MGWNVIWYSVVNKLPSNRDICRNPDIPNGLYSDKERNSKEGKKELLSVLEWAETFPPGMVSSCRYSGQTNHEEDIMSDKIEHIYLQERGNGQHPPGLSPWYTGQQSKFDSCRMCSYNEI